MCVQGQWAVLQNGQHVASMLAALENVVSEPGTDGLTQVKEPFRCWIMAQAASHVPLNLLQHALKIVLDVPKVSPSLVWFFTCYHIAIYCRKEHQ